MLPTLIYNKSQFTLKNVILEIICFLLILLFSYAGLSKLINIGTFKYQLGRSPFVTNIAVTVAWILPIIELTISILLVIKKSRLIGLYASFFLMLLFTGYIYAMLHYSYYVPCSCGGALSMMSWNQHLIFNIFFSLIALAGIFLQAKKISNDN